MKGKNRTTKWTKKIKALIISLSLAFVVALGGACAAIGLSMSDNGRLGGSLAGGVADENTPEAPQADETFYAGVTVGETTYATNAQAWAAAVEYSLDHSDEIVQFNLTRSWTADAETGFGAQVADDPDAEELTYAKSPFGAAGSLNVPTGAKIILNISKNVKLNRNVGETAIDNGSVITVVGGTLYVTGEGTITGGNSTIRGGGIWSNGGAVIIYGGTISGNNTDIAGGGVYSSGFNVTIYGGKISNNTATTVGAGVCKDSGALTISGGEISGNITEQNGGAVYTYASNVTISGGNILNNSTGGSGGGIFFNGPTKATISGGKISGNTANTGGGIHTSGNSIVTISGGEISNNTVTGNGGGLYSNMTGENNEDGSIKTYGLTITGGTISNNTAKDNGGGIFGNTNSTIILSGGTISNNYLTSYGTNAVGGGGGIYTKGALDMTSGTDADGKKTEPIIENNKSQRGGGVYATASMTMSAGIIRKNETYPNSGAGIFKENSANGDTVVMTGGEISDNTTTNRGGGVFVGNYCNFIFNGGKVINNIASVQGGGFCTEGIGSLTIEPDGNNSSATRELTGNNALSGGGIYTYSGTTLTINGNVLFEKNSSVGNGGAIFTTGNTIIQNCNISENSASSNGGAIYQSAGTLTITGKSATEKLEITDNTAISGEGGAIYQAAGTLELTNCLLEGNKAGGAGGGIRLLGKAKLTSCTLTGNDGRDGGAIYYSPNSNLLEFKDVTMTGNSASWFGGGITAGFGAKIALDGKIDISGNTSGGIANNAMVVCDGSDYFHVAEGGSITAGSKIGVNPYTYSTKENGNIFFTGEKPDTLELFADNPDYYEISTTGTESKFVLKSGISTDNATRWNAAVAESLSKYSATNTDPNHNQVRFELFSGWTADAGFKFGPEGDGINANGTIVVPKNANIVLDLHHYNINRGVTGTMRLGTLMLDVQGTLTIVGDGNISGSKCLHYGTAPISVTGTLNMYGGKFNGNAGGSGGAVSIYGGTFNMYGGQISENAAESGIYEGNTVGGVGGAVSMSHGTFNMYNGTIFGNTAASYGGAVYAYGGTFNMYGGTISGNTSADNGAGVYLEEGATFNMSGGTISGNKHTTSDKCGAGVYSVGTMTISGTAMITGNGKTKTETTAGIAMTMNGGGICTGGTFTMSGGTISSNNSKWGGGLFVSAAGSTTNIISGGVIKSNVSIDDEHYGGGGVMLNTGTLTMTGGEISGNTANHYGGGVYILSGTFNFGSVTGTGANAVYSGTGKILNNRADDGVDTTNNLGGGVFVNYYDSTNLSKFNLYSGEISNNIASYGGGVAVFHLANFEMFGGTISKNTVSVSGSGIYVGDITSTTTSTQKTVVKIHGGEISGNTSTANGAINLRNNVTFIMDGGVIKNNTSAASGGFALGSWSTATLSGTAQVINNTVTGNGGGIVVYNGSTLTIDGENVKIDGNTATSQGGGIHVNANGSLILEKGTISGNTSVSDGGGIYNCGSFVMNDGLITKNNALSGGGVSGSGTDAIIELYGGTITENVAKGNGGGVGITCSATIDGVTISRNSAGLGGGFNNWGDGIIEFKSGTITENWSGTGGGISIYQPDDTRYDYSKLIISGDAVISGNDAETVGGGVYVRGKLEMSEDAVISGNKAENGGGVYVYTGATFTMSGGTIGGATKEDANTANFGGGVYVAGTLTLSESGQIKNNNASDSGGGVFVNESVMNMSGGTISGNSANSGGGVLFYGDRPTNRGTGNFSGGTVSGNTAIRYGGGVWVWKDTKFNVSGSPVITGNTRTDGTVDNTYLNSAEAWITVSGVLTNNARIGVTNVGNQLRTVTSGFGSKNSSNAATLAGNVFKADAEGVVAVYESNEVVLKTGYVLTVKYDGEKVGSITAVAGKTIEGEFDENTKTYTLKQSDAAANKLDVVFDKTTVPDGYAAYMYDETDPYSAEIASIKMDGTETVVIVTKAIEKPYTIKYILQGVDGSYNETAFVSATRQGVTDTPVVVMDENGKPFATIQNGDQYTLDALYDNGKGVKVAGDGSTEVFVYLKRNEYTVTFSSTGATPPSQNVKFRYEETISAPSRVPTQKLRTFNGWYLGDEKIISYNATTKTMTVEKQISVTSNITLTAKYDVATYHLQFDMNIGGESNGLDIDFALPGNSEDVTSAGLESGEAGTNYYVSWNTDALFDASFNYRPDGTNTFIIDYSIENVPYSMSIKNAKPTAIGYTFNGWKNSATGKTTDIIPAPSSSTSTEDDIVYIAQWKPTTYTVYFDKQDGSRNPITPTSIQNTSQIWDFETDELTVDGIETPTRNGYSFDGWYTTAGVAIQYRTVDGKFSIDQLGSMYEIGDTNEYDLSAMTLTAHWVSENIYIQYSDSTLVAGQKANISLTFTASEDGALFNNKNISINNGTVTNSLGNETHALHVGDVVKVNVAILKSGYKFTNLVIRMSSTRTVELPAGETEFTLSENYISKYTHSGDEYYVINVEAKYTEDSYRIDYDWDGGKIADTTIKRSYKPSEIGADALSRAALPSKLTKLGYTFAGWLNVETNKVAFVPDEEVTDGNMNGKTLWLTVPEEEESNEPIYSDLSLKAIWTPQTAKVHLYNASYNGVYDGSEADGYVISKYPTDSDTSVTTGMPVEIVNPTRSSFDFLGWATSNNGAVMYPVKSGVDTISYTVNADYSVDGKPLNNNNLYAVWHIKGVDRIIMTVTNNDCVYGGDGITMSAKPAQGYEIDGSSSVTLNFNWYRALDGMYEECFTYGYVYIGKNDSGESEVMGYEFNGVYSLDVDGKNVVAKPDVEELGYEKLEYKRFDTTSIGTACKLVDAQTDMAPGSTSTLTVKNVRECGNYICAVEAVGNAGTTTKAGGYGEVEIKMTKAVYGNLVLENANPGYNAESQWQKVKLALGNKTDGSTLVRNGNEVKLTLPDLDEGEEGTGSTIIVTYKYYRVDGVKRVPVEASDVKDVGTYIVKVEFAWAAGGDKGNYEAIEAMEAELIIDPYEINNIRYSFKHGDSTLATDNANSGTTTFAGAYDGTAYEIAATIRNTFGVGTDYVTDTDDIALDVAVYKVVGNEDQLYTDATVNSGTYCIVVGALTGEDSGNYVLGSGLTLRKEYSIGKSVYDVKDNIKFEDDTVEFDNQLHKLEIEILNNKVMPETIDVVYEVTDYVPETASFDKNDHVKDNFDKDVDNAGRYAGVYTIEVRFEFNDEEAKGNYEKLETLTATLTITKANLFDYFADVYGEDLLADAGFVGKTYKYDPNITYTFAAAAGSRLADENGNNLKIECKTQMVDGDIEHWNGTVNAEGKYEILIEITYLKDLYKNNFEEVQANESTIVYVIEKVDVKSVTATFTDAFTNGGSVAKLGATFDHTWISQIVLVYEYEDEVTGNKVTSTRIVNQEDDIKLAEITYEKRTNGGEESSFWKVGTFDVWVEMYGKKSDSALTVNVKQDISEFELQYSTNGEAWSTVGSDGIDGIEYGPDYQFRVTFAGINEYGNTFELGHGEPLPVIRKDSSFKLGKNVLKVDADNANGNYVITEEIAVTMYKVISNETPGLSWQYYDRKSGTWVNLSTVEYTVPYIGEAYSVQVAFTDGGKAQTGAAKAVENDEEVAVLNSNGYSMVVGLSGNYLVTATCTVSVAPYKLTVVWSDNGNGFTYSGMPQAPTVTSADFAAIDEGKITFSYEFEDGLGYHDVVNAGEYTINAVLEGDSEVLANYTLENSNGLNYAYEIHKADIAVTVEYNEMNYGVNVTYANNRQGLRESALQYTFTGATVPGKPVFISGVDAEGKPIVVDGNSDDIKNLLKTVGNNISVKYAFIPEEEDGADNYNVKTGTIPMRVKAQAYSTGSNALLIVLGESAKKSYLLNDTFRTTGISVYRLYESYYTEGGEWFGYRGETAIINPTLKINTKTANGLKIEEQYVTDGYITLTASTGTDQGTLLIPISEKAADTLEIKGDYKKVYYVGEKPDFSELVFKITFEDDTTEDVTISSVECDFNGTFTTAEEQKAITFSYFGADLTIYVEVKEKENLTIVPFTEYDKILVLENGSATIPALKFLIDEVECTTYDGIAVTYKILQGQTELNAITAEGTYQIWYTITITNPRFNTINSVYKVTDVTATDNPYRVTVTRPDVLEATYTGSVIEIPKPDIGEVTNTTNPNDSVKATVRYYINNVELTDAAEINGKWNRIHAGDYNVRVVVFVEGFATSIGGTEYKFVIKQAKNADLEVATKTVILGNDADFNFKVTAAFGADTKVLKYSQSEDKNSGDWTTELPTDAGTWYVWVTIEGNDDYTGLDVVKSFKVRYASADAIVGEGSIEGGNGIGKNWKLEIKQIEAEDVSQVAISSHDVLDGYTVVLKNENNVPVTDEGIYKVSITLSEELRGMGGLKVFFKDSDGKVKELKTSVKDGSIAFETSSFDGEFIIASEIAVEKGPVGLLVAVIVLGVVAAAGIAACIVVFLKKKKRGAK